ncbi:phosphoribulokinase [Pseudonocardia alaniniphila]|uniref:phosphoribulokinase n=1 Tax=Pseudonocardia alaniniphila TaxID=75291 RepID=A0ABS9TSL7_9PSEU|nr:phosphoribulokinase [Pseudonocardia alaniniphila]MCH6171506.1 phosphoribulokinase [Pseudonocardia alaniniphila]
MSHKLMQMQRAETGPPPVRPIMLGIAGDSAAGKTTLTGGLVEALGAARSTSLCVDDYHRYDRAERASLPFTPLHPDCNYVEIMEQHLQLLATGKPVLKPVYDHSDGTLTRPVLLEPREFVIVEGLLPLYTKLARACFDVTVFLAPPEDIRTRWKITRDTTKRGYTEEKVRAEMQRREPESERFIRSQRSNADIVIVFSPIEGRDDPPDTPLSATILLRPTIPHPPLAEILAETPSKAMHVKLMRDVDGSPVDALHIHGYAPTEQSTAVANAIWERLPVDDPLPDGLGRLAEGQHNEPLRLAQLILLYHLMGGA